MSDTPTLPVQPDPKVDQVTVTTTTAQKGAAPDAQHEDSAVEANGVKSEEVPAPRDPEQVDPPAHAEPTDPPSEPVGPAPQADPTDGSTTEQQSSIPRPADVSIPHPSLEELRRRVQETLAARKAASAQQPSPTHPSDPSTTAPSQPAGPSSPDSASESDTSSDSNSDSDSDSSSSSSSINPANAGDYKSLLRRRAELAKLLAEAQDQGDSDSEDDNENGEEFFMGPQEHGPDDEDEGEDDHRPRAQQQGGVAHALFQGPATKNELHSLPSAEPDPVPLPSGLKPGDHLPNDGRLRYLGVLQSVIDGAVVVVRQDVEKGGGALPPPRPGQTYLPYGGQLRTPGPHAEVYAVLDTGSLLCLQDGTVVGAVFETFGSLQEPFYSILLPQDEPTKKEEPKEAPKDEGKKGNEGVASSAGVTQDAQATPTDEQPPAAAAAAAAAPIEAQQSEPTQEEAQPQASDAQPTDPPSAPEPQPTESAPSSPPDAKPFRAIDLPMGTQIYFDMVTCSVVETAQLKLMPKGSDASNLHDEEVGEDEQEYSDDEAEQAAKRARKKRPAHSNPNSRPNQADKRPRNGREYSLPGQPALQPTRPYEPGRGGGRGGRGRGRGRGGAMGRSPALSYAPAAPIAAPTTAAMGYAAPMPMGMPMQPGYAPTPYNPAMPGAPTTASGGAAPRAAPVAPAAPGMPPPPSGYWPYYWPQVPQPGWADPNVGYNPAQPGYPSGPPPS